MMAVRDAVRAVFQTQLEDASEERITEARKQLNEAYDSFVRRHGALSSRDNVKAFAGDPDQPLLLSNPLTSLLGSGGTVVVSGLGFGLDVNTPPSNIGVYQVSMLTDPPALSGDVELFTLSFQALQASPSAKIGVEPVAGGAYGTGSPFMPSASTPITVLPSAVPEPAAWALGLSGLALLVGIGSRRRRL